MPVYSFVADALSSLPDELQPTNLSERNVSQNFAFLDFQASYALFASVISSATFVGPGRSGSFQVVPSAFALFASTFPPHVAKMKAVAAVKPKCTNLAIIARINLVDRSAKYLKNLVGAPGFEPGASCAQGRRATRLRYAPT